MPRRIVLAAVLTGTFFAAAPAHAAGPWVDRAMTQDKGVLALNPGLGIAHVNLPRPLDDANGAGLNLEASYGITDRIELGLRTGIRFGDDGKATQADNYGRVLSTENYNTNNSTIANPEARITGVIYSGDMTEVGLDGRIMLPVETNSAFGMMFGVPIDIHVSALLRIDTGAFIPLQFYSHVHNGLSIPGYFWFQPTEKFWIGPMMQIRFIDAGTGDHDAHLALGVGLGYQVHPSIDLKAQLLFNTVDNGLGDSFGFGFGAEFRIGE